VQQRLVLHIPEQLALQRLKRQLAAADRSSASYSERSWNRAPAASRCQADDGTGRFIDPQGRVPLLFSMVASKTQG
jgi:hypothetical protein